MSSSPLPYIDANIDYLQRLNLAYNDAIDGYLNGILHVRDLQSICEHYRVMPGTVLEMCQNAAEVIADLKDTETE